MKSSDNSGPGSPLNSPARAARALAFLFLLGMAVPAAAAPPSAQEGRHPGDGWLTASQVYDPPRPFRERTVIILHGFGGSPYDVKPLMEALGESGFRLVAPVIPGETERTPLPERGKITPSEKLKWLEGIIADETERFGKKPYLVGFSMGGTLATLAAAKGAVDRLVLVSPYYALPWGDSFLTRMSRAFSSMTPVVPKPWKGQVNDPEGYDSYEPGLSTVSLQGFQRLQEAAGLARAKASELPPIPVLVLASPDDEVASYSVTEKLFGGRAGVEFVSFPGNNHILFYDYDREDALEKTREFLEREDSPQE